jgi:hypothetical protein
MIDPNTILVKAGGSDPAKDPEKTPEQYLSENKSSVLAWMTNQVKDSPKTYDQLVSGARVMFPLSKVQLYALCDELNRAWHPEKFDAKALGEDEVVIK